jgi:hypothetical protein
MENRRGITRIFLLELLDEIMDRLGSNNERGKSDNSSLCLICCPSLETLWTMLTLTVFTVNPAKNLTIFMEMDPGTSLNLALTTIF